jgi:hypothetical protein
MQIPPAISSVPKLEPASLQSLCMQTEPRFLVWGLAHRPRLSFFRCARLVKCPAGRSACRYVSLHCGSSRKQETNHLTTTRNKCRTPLAGAWSCAGFVLWMRIKPSTNHASDDSESYAPTSSCCPACALEMLGPFRFLSLFPSGNVEFDPKAVYFLLHAHRLSQPVSTSIVK